jgi:hypothetical protein
MPYEDPLIEQRKFDNIEQWTQNVFRPLGVPAPAYIEGEKLDQQRKRIMEKARPFVSEELQQIKRDDVFGTGLNHLEKQFMESAAEEATRPTKVPEGQLKEVKKYDQAGRASSEFYGSPKVWMDTFNATNRKRLVGIRVANESGFRPSNIG